jgi:hypothetical protein
MISRNAWARTAALTAAFALVSSALPAGAVLAQESPSIALEQARSNEDGSSGAGATEGGFSTGSAGRDKDGNAGSASAGDGGSTGGTATASDDGTGNSGGGKNKKDEEGGGETTAPPANAELLDALGVLDDVTDYGIDILANLDIPVELLPPPPAESAPAAAPDVETGGQSGSGVSTEPGTGSAPASGSTNSTSADGADSTSSGEKPKDREHRNADGGADTSSTTTEGGSTTTNGGATGS